MGLLFFAAAESNSKGKYYLPVARQSLTYKLYDIPFLKIRDPNTPVELLVMTSETKSKSFTYILGIK